MVASAIFRSKKSDKATSQGFSMNLLTHSLSLFWFTQYLYDSINLLNYYSSYLTGWILEKYSIPLTLT